MTIPKDQSIADSYSPTVVKILEAEDDSEEALEAIRAALVEGCKGFRLRPYVEMEDEVYFSGVEFHFVDHSTLLIAETDEGDICLFTSYGLRNSTLH